MRVPSGDQLGLRMSVPSISLTRFEPSALMMEDVNRIHLVVLDGVATNCHPTADACRVDHVPGGGRAAILVTGRQDDRFVSDRELYDFVSDFFVLSVADKSVERLTTTFSSSPFGQYYEPAWSHDGTMLAVDKCILEYQVCVVSATLAVMKRDGSGVRELASIRGWASPTWSPDDRTLAFSVGNNISWIHADASARGFIIDNGHSPAWRPLTAAQSVRR